MKKLAIFVSNTGTGSNLQAIIDAIKENKLQAHIALVISDSPIAPAVKKAENHQIPIVIVTKQTDLISLLTDQFPVDYICLCGFKQIIPDVLITAFENRILNLHPGIIPDTIDGVTKNPDGTVSLWNKGKITELAIQNVLQNKSTYAGSSIHFLTHEFDFGLVLGRTFEKVHKEDTVETLYKRLKQKENVLYVTVLQKLCNT